MGCLKLKYHIIPIPSFGSAMKARSYSSGAYRYGFNGMEEEDDLNGSGYTTIFRQFDVRIARWVSIDPVKKEDKSSYETNSNKPITNSDPNGDCDDCSSTVDIGVKIAIGGSKSGNAGISATIAFTQKVGDWTASAGFGIGLNSNFNNTGKSGAEMRLSMLGGYDNENTSATIGTNVFKGIGEMKEFNQRTGIVNLKFGEVKFSYENDGMPFAVERLGSFPYLGDGDDKYRTAAVKLSFGEGENEISVGFNLFTGFRDDYKGDKNEMKKGVQTGAFGERMPYGYVKEEGEKYRMGALYLGAGPVKIGIDSDRWVRHPIQDHFAHGVASKQPGFRSTSNNINLYFKQTSTIFKTSDNFPRFTLYGNN